MYRVQTPWIPHTKRHTRKSKLEQTIKEALIHIVGQTNFTDQLIDMISYSYDGSDHNHRPEAAVWPVTTEQISEIMILANKHRFPVIPRGAGTGLAGAAIAAKGVHTGTVSSDSSFSKELCTA